MCYMHCEAEAKRTKWIEPFRLGKHNTTSYEYILDLLQTICVKAVLLKYMYNHCPNI